VSAPIVRTVRGDVDPRELGPCDAHEHFFLETPVQPGDTFLDRDKAVEEARTLVQAGARAVVDWTPLGLGRDLAGLRRVSEETGLHVVGATGLHRDPHYAPDDPVRRESAESLAERFVADVTGDGVRSGVIKLGASYHVVTPFEATAFEAGARAYAATGAPLCVHTEHGTMGLALVERLGGLGVPAESVVLAHLDRNPDAGEHAETAAARRAGAHEVLAGLDDPAARRRPGRARVRRTAAPRRRHRPAVEHACIRRRAGDGLRLRALQAAARAGARTGALRPDLRREPGARVRVRAARLTPSFMYTRGWTYGPDPPPCSASA
jgi:Phosphotriesterase family